LVLRLAESLGGSFDGCVGGSIGPGAGGGGTPSVVFLCTGGASVAASGGAFTVGSVMPSLPGGGEGIGCGSGDGSSGRERGAGRARLLGAAIGGGVGVRGRGAVRGGGRRFPQWPHSGASSEFSCAQKGQKRIGPIS
jgi:hypothetical protein